MRLPAHSRLPPKNQLRFRRELISCRYLPTSPTAKLARLIVWLCAKGDAERACEILAALSRFRGPRATVAVVRAAERLSQEAAP
jgi:hypothetical protein